MTSSAAYAQGFPPPAAAGSGPSSAPPAASTPDANVAPPTPPAGQTSAGAAATADSAGCFPACRTGYTCHQGQCLSSCNPACSPGERCTAAGECEGAAAVAAPPAVSSQPAPAPVPSPAAPEQHARGSIEPSVLRSPGTFVFQAQLGLELFGTGHAEESCTSSMQGECLGSINVDFEDRSQALVSLAGLFHVARGLRLGVGYGVMPYSGIRTMGTDDNRKIHLGHEHALNAIVEGLVPLRPSLALSLRAHAGPRLLVVGGDLKRDNELFLSDCSMQRVGRHCEASKGPFFGATFGTMLGIVVGERVRWRADLAVERHSLKVRDQNTVDEPNLSLGVSRREFGQERMLYATRFWLLAGLEL